MHLGIFGGTFDPVHYGHLLLAEYCREQCKLDQLWFVPAAVPPHKQDRKLSTDEQRVEMLRLALGGHEQMVVSTLELERGGVSYTVDTLETVSADRPDTQVYLLMGADSLTDLTTWRDPQRIFELARLVVVCRPDAPSPDPGLLRPVVAAKQLDAIDFSVVQMPLIQLSSTEIRRRVGAGESIRYQTPRAVEKYIETNHMYRG